MRIHQIREQHITSPHSRHILSSDLMVLVGFLVMLTVEEVNTFLQIQRNATLQALGSSGGLRDFFGTRSLGSVGFSSHAL